MVSTVASHQESLGFTSWVGRGSLCLDVFSPESSTIMKNKYFRVNIQSVSTKCTDIDLTLVSGRCTTAHVSPEDGGSNAENRFYSRFYSTF